MNIEILKLPLYKFEILVLCIFDEHNIAEYLYKIEYQNLESNSNSWTVC